MLPEKQGLPVLSTNICRYDHLHVLSCGEYLSLKAMHNPQGSCRGSAMACFYGNAKGNKRSFPSEVTCFVFFNSLISMINMPSKDQDGKHIINFETVNIKTV